MKINYNVKPNNVFISNKDSIDMIRNSSTHDALREHPKELQSKINVIFKINIRGNRNPFDDDRHSHKEHKKENLSSKMDFQHLQKNNYSLLSKLST